MSEKVKVILEPGAYMPEKAHRADAGYDLRTPKDFSILPHRSGVMNTGVHMFFQPGTAGLIVSKSGLNIRDGLTADGLVDAEYQGSIVVKLYNNEGRTKTFEEGDKITQIVPIKVVDTELELVASFDEETERGSNGFGSSGR